MRLPDLSLADERGELHGLPAFAPAVIIWLRHFG